MLIYPKKQILRALKKTSKKWSNIYQEQKGKELKSCPLCEMFLFFNGCQMCPVMNKTGLAKCKGTPYEDWTIHRRKVHNTILGHEFYCEECKSHAGKWFDFIINLLKEWKKIK